MHTLKIVKTILLKIQEAPSPFIKCVILKNTYCYSQNIWDIVRKKLCEIAYYGKSLISVFQEIFPSTDKIFTLRRRLSTMQ